MSIFIARRVYRPDRPFVLALGIDESGPHLFDVDSISSHRGILGGRSVTIPAVFRPSDRNVRDGFQNRFIVIMVLLAFCEKEDVFMCLGTPVLYGFGHWVRLMPDNVLSQNPTVFLQCKSNSPRDSHQTFFS